MQSQDLVQSLQELIAVIEQLSYQSFVELPEDYIQRELVYAFINGVEAEEEGAALNGQ
jgi:hypothetical protein